VYKAQREEDGLSGSADRMTADASSVILLAKAGGLEPLTSTVTLYYPPAVAAEVFNPVRVGVEGGVIQRAIDSGGIVALPGPPVDAFPADEAVLICHRLSETDAILTDDGGLIRLLAAEAIPHLNSLLVPALLVGRGSMSWSDAERLFGRIHLAGRYTPWVVEEARRRLSASLHTPPEKPW
jgi:hypothetical protein